MIKRSSLGSPWGFADDHDPAEVMVRHTWKKSATRAAILSLDSPVYDVFAFLLDLRTSWTSRAMQHVAYQKKHLAGGNADLGMLCVVWSDHEAHPGLPLDVAGPQPDIEWWRMPVEVKLRPGGHRVSVRVGQDAHIPASQSEYGASLLSRGGYQWTVVAGATATDVNTGVAPCIRVLVDALARSGGMEGLSGDWLNEVKVLRNSLGGASFRWPIALDVEPRIHNGVMYLTRLLPDTPWVPELRVGNVDSVYFDVSGLSEEQISETVSQLRSSVAGIPNLFEPILIGPLPQVSDSLAEVLGRERICSTSFSFEDYTGRLRERRTV